MITETVPLGSNPKKAAIMQQIRGEQKSLRNLEAAAAFEEIASEISTWSRDANQRFIANEDHLLFHVK